MPYNPETEQFFQAPATIVDSTPDGDTVQEGFDDRLTPAMAGVYTDLNLLKENGMIGVGIPATTTSRGISRVATLADMEPGAVIENGPAFLAAGSEAVTTTPTANAVPQADASGTLDAWVTPGANTDLSNVDLDKVSLTLQRVRYQTGEHAISQTLMPSGNAVPQITTGTQFMSINFTPRQAGSRLRIDVMFNGAGFSSTGWNMVCAVFQDSIPDALASVVAHGTDANQSRTLPLSFEVTSDSTETRTYSVRAGCEQGGIGFNSKSNDNTTLGGTRVSYIGVTEYAK